MVSRKVQQLGGSTLTVSLPRAWAQALPLKKGDEVELVESRDSLVISKPSRKEEAIDCSKLERREALELLTEAYRRGADEVTLKNPPKNPHELISRLPGLEITSESPKSATMEFLSVQEGPENALARLEAISKGITRDSKSQSPDSIRTESLEKAFNSAFRAVQKSKPLTMEATPLLMKALKLREEALNSLKHGA